MAIPFKKDHIEYNQKGIFTTNVFDLLPCHNPCFPFEHIFQQLETSNFEGNYILLCQNGNYTRPINIIPIHAYNKGIINSHEIGGIIKTSPLCLYPIVDVII